MTNYRFILQPYAGVKSRFICPLCQHRNKTFKRYIDTETNLHLAGHVGKCDRVDKCGYHYTPAEYFKQNPQSAPARISPIRQRPTHRTYNTIPLKYMQQGMGNMHSNNFLCFLNDCFGKDVVAELAEKYHISTSHHWQGATVFWQMDVNGKLRTGKVMLYDKLTCSRVKEPYNHIAWAHTLLYARTAGFNLKQCLFGEHLLALHPDISVAITESEKTAVMASYMMPQFIWLAAGSKQGLDERKCQVLKNRTVMLFPDVGVHGYWQERADTLNKKIPGASFTVHDEMETTATDEERANAADMADRWIGEWLEEMRD